MAEAAEFSRVSGISGSEKEFQILQEVTPHQRLLGKIFGREQSPISKAREEELHDVLDEAIAKLSERRQTVLNLRFGLKGEPRKTLEEIKKVLGVSRERIHQIELRSIRDIRIRDVRRFHLPNQTGTELWKYLSLPKSSMAKRITDLPLTTEGELKIFESMDLEELGIALPWVRSVISRSKEIIINVRDVLFADAEPYVHHLSREQIENLKVILGQIYGKAQARQKLNIDREKGLLRERIKFTVGYGSGEKKPGVEGQQNMVEEPHRNVFMPELSEEVVSKIWDRPLNDLSLSMGTRNPLKRAGFRTIGEILKMSVEEPIYTIKRFGVGRLRELQSALVKYTNILQEKV